MKLKKMVIVIFCGVIFLSGAGIEAQQDPADLLGSMLGQTAGNNNLSDNTIVKGLLEALKVGTSNAVSTVSLKDGYLGNELIKIPLPKDLKNAESIIRMAGFGDKLDDFVISMNRAAEKAAPEAQALFLDALKQITFDDARKILNGRENEATLYFKSKTEQKLFKVFQPIVQESLATVGVTKSYQDLETTINALPIKGAGNFNLEEYVTSEALDGLFKVVEQEEKKIRENPEDRVSDILKTVFGK